MKNNISGIFRLLFIILTTMETDYQKGLKRYYMPSVLNWKLLLDLASINEKAISLSYFKHSFFISSYKFPLFHFLGLARRVWLKRDFAEIKFFSLVYFFSSWFLVIFLFRVPQIYRAQRDFKVLSYPSFKNIQAIWEPILIVTICQAFSFREHNYLVLFFILTK